MTERRVPLLNCAKASCMSGGNGPYVATCTRVISQNLSHKSESKKIRLAKCKNV